MSSGLSSFDKATAVERDGPGHFSARVDPAWDGPGAPLGGVVMATILRAMTAELAAADLAPRSVTAHFLRPLIHGLIRRPCDVWRCSVGAYVRVARNTSSPAFRVRR